MIKTEDIQKLADLARIKISEDEIKNFAEQIDSILGYVGSITKMDGNLEKTIPKLRNVMRDDVPTTTRGEYTEKILSNAPSREGDYLKVKKIL